MSFRSFNVEDAIQCFPDVLEAFGSFLDSVVPEGVWKEGVNVGHEGFAVLLCIRGLHIIFCLEVIVLLGQVPFVCEEWGKELVSLNTNLKRVFSMLQWGASPFCPAVLGPE